MIRVGFLLLERFKFGMLIFNNFLFLDTENFNSRDSSNTQIRPTLMHMLQRLHTNVQGTSPVSVCTRPWGAGRRTLHIQTCVWEVAGCSNGRTGVHPHGQGTREQSNVNYLTATHSVPRPTLFTSIAKLAARFPAAREI